MLKLREIFHKGMPKDHPLVRRLGELLRQEQWVECVHGEAAEEVVRVCDIIDLENGEVVFMDVFDCIYTTIERFERDDLNQTVNYGNAT